jgi:hypothetical protein
MGTALAWLCRLSDRMGARLPMLVGSIGSAFGVASVFWANAVMLARGGMLNRSGRA